MCVDVTLLTVVRTLFQHLCACVRTCVVFSQDSVEPTSFTFKYIISTTWSMCCLDASIASIVYVTFR